MGGKSLGASLATAVAALACTASAAGFGALSGPGTIRITDKLVRHLHVDAGHDGAGNLDFYRRLLFTKGTQPKSIGHSDVTCIDTGTGSRNCSGTYFLPRGKIMVEGVLASQLFYELAVVGGTGIYDNVRGTLTVTYLGGDPVREFLLFRLTV